MCGITGLIGNYNAFFYCINGLELLEYRGYDSCGYCCFNKGKFLCKKLAKPPISPTNEIKAIGETKDDKSGIQILKEEAEYFKTTDDMIGIAHTRWATHGAKIDTNAHPHISVYKEGVCDTKFSIVHNGIINNYDTLKKSLYEEHGIECVSATDSEVIVNLISVYYNKLKNVEKAIETVTNLLEGTWGIIVLCEAEPNKMYCARNGSQLLIGFGGDFIMVSSDTVGFCNFISDYVFLEDGDIVTLSKNGKTVKLDQLERYKINNLSKSEILTSPGEFKHWTNKEIHEQRTTVKLAYNNGGRLIGEDVVKLGGIEKYRKELKEIDHLILLGCGTSLHAAELSISFFQKLSNFTTVSACDGAEFNKNKIPKRGKTALVLISQSGETRDLHRCIKIGREYGLFLIGVVNAVNSLIYRDTDCGIYLNAGKEIGVASTKAYTSQVTVLSLLAMWFGQLWNENYLDRKHHIESLRKLHISVTNTIKNTEKICKSMAEYISNNIEKTKDNKILILGSGESYVTAKEGALKIIETTRIMCQGYGGKSLRHGPYAAIKEGTIIIFVMPDNEYMVHMKNTIEEVKCRGAIPICITDSKEDIKHAEHIIRVDFSKHYSSILHVIPLQLIAYYLALIQGCNPDKPINLAKVVSV